MTHSGHRTTHKHTHTQKWCIYGAGPLRSFHRSKPKTEVQRVFNKKKIRNGKKECDKLRCRCKGVFCVCSPVISTTHARIRTLTVMSEHIRTTKSTTRVGTLLPLERSTTRRVDHKLGPSFPRLCPTSMSRFLVPAFFFSSFLF